MASPIYSLSDWAAAQASPWNGQNSNARALEALIRGSIADRDLSAPPGSCANGAAYLVKASGTGAWAGKSGQMAISLGANAVNGWLFAAIATEGKILWIEDENIRIEYNGSAWVTYSPGGSGAGVPKVRAATTANGTLATAFENGDAIDGVTLATGDRILIKNQSAPAENGIYVVAASGAPARASDADSSDELVNYACFVAEGTANADKFFQCTTNAPITVGTTALTFTEFSGGGLSDAPSDGTEYVRKDAAWVHPTGGTPTESLIVACGDEVTGITTGAGKVTFRMPYAFTLTDVRANCKIAPTGAAILIDINEGGTTILSTKLMIDAGEKTSVTATTPAVISDTALADDAEITVDFDQVGSSVTGAGVKIALVGHR